MKEIPPLPQPERINTLLQTIAPGSRLVDLRPLDGSFSNSTVLATAVTPTNHTHQFVVRRYAVFGDYDRGEKARREYKTLALLAAHGLPVPEPLFLDTTGGVLDTPGIVTSFVAGGQVIAPVDVGSWVRELAATLAQIHAVPVTAVETSFLLNANAEVVWFLKSGHVPDYMQQHPQGEAIWQAVHDLLPALVPVRPGLVHVDYWTGNILWQGGRITAVLDWEEAAYGDPGYDVAYMRAELALLGSLPLADQFLAVYEAESGSPVANLPLWELAASVRFIENPAGMIPEWQTFADIPVTPELVNQRFDQFVTQARRKVRI
ncbi:MAG: phosphotransferase family protein [Anaerolineae bacterium]|nr:phosphotransferase family protein [Anaerolineae bacterium]